MLSKTKTQGGVKSVTAIYIQGMKGGMVEVAGIESAPPNGLQLYDIIRYN